MPLKQVTVDRTKLGLNLVKCAFDGHCTNVQTGGISSLSSHSERKQVILQNTEVYCSPINNLELHNNADITGPTSTMSLI